jgi:hypothetical protein
VNNESLVVNGQLTNNILVVYKIRNSFDFKPKSIEYFHQLVNKKGVFSDKNLNNFAIKGPTAFVMDLKTDDEFWLLTPSVCILEKMEPFYG